MKKAIINGGIGSKVICAVTDDVTLEAAPIKGTDNGDGTASLLVTSSMAELPDTASGDLAAINSASASIDGKLPALVDGKIPVDVLVSIDSVDIGDVDIKDPQAGAPHPEDAAGRQGPQGAAIQHADPQPGAGDRRGWPHRRAAQGARQDRRDRSVRRGRDGVRGFAGYVSAVASRCL